MIINVSNTISVLLLDASGDGVAGLTPTVTISQNGGAYGAATNTPTDQGGGKYSLALEAAELNAKHVAVSWTDAGAKPVVQNLYPLDPVLFQANVSNLDVAVSTRSNHSAADAGTDAASKVLVTPANLLKTDAQGEVTAENMRGTDNAALSNEVIKKGTNYRYTNDQTSTPADPWDQVTVSDAS